jgi:hypothetical protein
MVAVYYYFFYLDSKEAPYGSKGYFVPNAKKKDFQDLFINKFQSLTWLWSGIKIYNYVPFYQKVRLSQ